MQVFLSVLVRKMPKEGVPGHESPWEGISCTFTANRRVPGGSSRPTFLVGYDRVWPEKHKAKQLSMSPFFGSRSSSRLNVEPTIMSWFHVIFGGENRS